MMGSLVQRKLGQNRMDQGRRVNTWHPASTTALLGIRRAGASLGTRIEVIHRKIQANT